MKISVVIPTMNRAPDLRKALESILIQSAPPFEVIIVDQSSNEDSYHVVEELKSQALSSSTYLRHVLQNEKSLVKARNRGILLADGEIVSFLDDDVVLFRDYFSSVSRAFESDSRIVGVSGNVIVKKKQEGAKWWLRKAVMKFFLLSDFNGRMTASGFGTPIHEREIDRMTEVELLTGCDMNFRKDAMGDENFDEWFVGYSFREDVDFSYRISSRGKCVMIPEAKLHHNYSSSDRLDVGALTKMMIKNYHHVFQKYKNIHIYSRLLFIYSLLGLILMDCVEYISKRDPARFYRVRAEISSVIGLMTNGMK